MAAKDKLFLALAAGALVLAGCLNSPKPVLTEATWEDIPGATGHWTAPGDTGREVFVKKNADGSYASANKPGNYDLTWSAVPLGNGKYVAQYSVRGGESVLCLLRVSPKFLLIYNIETAAIRNAAAELQLPLVQGKASATLAAGADKARLKALYTKLSKDASLEKRWIFERRGGFIDADGRAANNAAALQKAMAAGDPRATLRIWEYRAARGDADAQQQLAHQYATRFHDPKRAIGAALDAYASGNRKVSPTLAWLYRAGTIDMPALNAAPANPDNEQALFWLARAIADGEAVSAAQQLRGAWSAEACARTPPLAPDKLKNCMETMPVYVAHQAATERQIMDLDDKLVANFLAQQTVLERRRQNERQETTPYQAPSGPATDEARRKIR